MFTKNTFILVAATTLTACGSGGGGTTGTGSGSGPVSAQQAQDFLDEINDFNSDYVAATSKPMMTNLPSTGGATYEGALGVDITTPDAVGTALGKLEMTADFSSDDLSGSVTDINAMVVDANAVNSNNILQEDLYRFDMDGTLTIDGRITGSTAIATAEGVLAYDDPLAGASSTDLRLTLNGDFHGNGTTPSDVAGTVSGGSVGGTPVTVTNGYFVGSR